MLLEYICTFRRNDCGEKKNDHFEVLRLNVLGKELCDKLFYLRHLDSLNEHLQFPLENQTTLLIEKSMESSSLDI
jgi:hypothetical protein